MFLFSFTFPERKVKSEKNQKKTTKCMHVSECLSAYLIAVQWLSLPRICLPHFFSRVFFFFKQNIFTFRLWLLLYIIVVIVLVPCFLKQLKEKTTTKQILYYPKIIGKMLICSEQPWVAILALEIFEKKTVFGQRN